MKVDKNILIIDDHDSIRFILGNILGKSYNVTTKEDGLLGLKYLSAGNIPDLILLDMSMPRLNGLEFLSVLRSSGFFREIPVLIVSGKDNEKYVEQCTKLGASGYITKPFNPITLKEQIENIFQTSPRHKTTAH